MCSAHNHPAKLFIILATRKPALRAPLSASQTACSLSRIKTNVAFSVACFYLRVHYSILFLKSEMFLQFICRFSSLLCVFFTIFSFIIQFFSFIPHVSIIFVFRARSNYTILFFASFSLGIFGIFFKITVCFFHLCAYNIR